MNDKTEIDDYSYQEIWDESMDTDDEGQKTILYGDSNDNVSWQELTNCMVTMDYKKAILSWEEWMGQLY